MTRDEYIEQLKYVYVKDSRQRQQLQELIDQVRESGKQKTKLKQLERQLRQYDKFLQLVTKQLTFVGIDVDTLGSDSLE